MKSNLVKIIESIGLERKQAMVYLATLEVGGGSVSEIANKAKIERVNTYYVLNQLKQKGLVSSSKRKKVQIFSAIHPTDLVSQTEDNLVNIKKALPQLLAIENSNLSSPVIQFFEEEEGLNQMLEDILKTTKKLPTNQREVLSYVSSDNVLNFLKDKQNRILKRSIENKIRYRWILPNTTSSWQFIKNAKQYLLEIKLVDPAKFPLTTEVDIYGDKMALFGSKEHPLGVIIEHKEMVETQRQIFELAWLGANQG